MKSRESVEWVIYGLCCIISLGAVTFISQQNDRRRKYNSGAPEEANIARAMSLGLIFTCCMILFPALLLKGLKHSRAKDMSINIEYERESLYEIYVAHFFAVWSRRMWEMALPLVLVDIAGNSLRPIAIYTMFVYTGVIILQPAVGKWCDVSNRLSTQLLNCTVENVSVAATCVCFMMVSVYSPDREYSETSVAMFGILMIAFGISGEVSVNAASQMLEKDWVVVIAKTNNMDMSQINTQLRRIDLGAKSLGPAVFAFFYGSFGSNAVYRVFFSMALLLLWNILSYPLEIVYLHRVYNRFKELQMKAHHHSDGSLHMHNRGEVPHFHINRSGYGTGPEKNTTAPIEIAGKGCCQNEHDHFHCLPSDPTKTFLLGGEEHNLQSLQQFLYPDEKKALEESQSLLTSSGIDGLHDAVLVGFRNKAKGGIFGQIAGWKEHMMIFFHHEVFLAGFAFSLLYFQVLSNGSLMTAFLHIEKTPPFIVGLGRGFGALFGMTATFIYPQVVKKFGVEATGALSIYMFLILLMPILAAFFFWPNSSRLPYFLITFTMFSRTGLWMFDLSITQIHQERVAEDVRGVVASAQTSSCQFFYLCVQIAALAFPESKDFGILACASIAAVVVASGIITDCYILRLFSNLHDMEEKRAMISLTRVKNNWNCAVITLILQMN